MTFVSFIESKFGDLDELFGFQTQRIVVIKDRFLGLLALSLKIAIIIYLVMTVVVDRGYYLIAQPRGTSRMTIRMPDIAKVPDPQKLSYCNTSSTTFVDGAVMPCQFWTTEELNVPSLGNQLFVTTRVTKTVHNFTCAPDDRKCIIDAGTYPGEMVAFRGFIAGVENATLYIDHTVEGSGNVRLSRKLSEMKGTFEDCNGNVRKTMPRQPDNIDRTKDILSRIVTVEQLFAWSRNGMHGSCSDRVTLDSLSRNNPMTEPNNTIRYDGIVMHIIINYDNTRKTDDVEYTVSIILMDRTDSKYVERTIRDVDVPSTTISENRHGVHIMVIQTGRLAQFSLAALVISLTAGLGLLAVANTITDLLAKHVMPLREEYRKLIFVYSQDFSEWKKQKKQQNTENAEMFYQSAESQHI